MKFKVDNKNVNSPNLLFLESISDKFDYVKVAEVLIEGTVYDFSVDSDAIDKSGIPSIHNYLMVKNNRN